MSRLRRVEKINITRLAYRLGAEDELMKEWFDDGRIELKSEGYRVKTLESGNGFGELAYAGDYVMQDEGGNIYPITETRLSLNYDPAGEHLFKPQPCSYMAFDESDLKKWKDKLPDEVRYLIDVKGLKISPEEPDYYYSVYIWGTLASAAHDAVVLIYEVRKDNAGNINGVDFNFVERKMFDRSYRWKHRLF